MRTTNLLFTIVSVVMATLLVAIGIFAILWPWVPHFRASVIYFLQTGGWMITLVGLLSVGLGILVLSGFYIMNRRTYYHVTMGSQSVQVDESLISDYLTNYWSEVFPGRVIPTEVRVRKNQIMVSSDLPYINFDEQKALLQKIEGDLTQLFEDVLDYRQEFLFSASFEEPPEALRTEI